MKSKIALFSAAVFAAVSLSGCTDNKELLDKNDNSSTSQKSSTSSSQESSSSSSSSNESSSSSSSEPEIVVPEVTFTQEDIENSKKWLTIEDNVLVSCSFDATKVVIPDGVTKIDNDAFAGCISLTSIKVPDSVTEIGACAFEGCTNISVTYKGKTYDYAHTKDLYNAING